MNDNLALEIANKIFNTVFNKDNTFTLDQLLEKFAFDIKLPKQVYDSTTNEVTWADSISGERFITQENQRNKEDWMLPKKDISNLQELIDLWSSINLTTTERVFDSVNVAKSDTIYESENVYRCTDCYSCKNILYCDSCREMEYILASQRSKNCSFCIRTDDSKNCSNSYNVICSNKVINSLFIQDCYDLYECIFCSHIASKRYCIANMQFEEEEYFQIKKLIVDWILSS